ncbi:MAG: efflux RND transporter periplasmic adaptor subunit [Planctomycetes bacterium]|nr:efflux RND transporter periplasmic adaptor subunit [Planctomycetota bacterium]
MKKLLLVVIILGLGVAAGVLGYRRHLAGQQAAVTGALRLHGNVDVRDAQLAFFGNERIEKVLVEEGARVEAGELLATLHSERLRASLAAAQARIQAQEAQVARLSNGTRPEELEQARAALAVAKVRVDTAARVLDRVKSTTQSGASSAQDLDNAQSAYDIAQAEQNVQQQSLALALAGPRAEDKAQAQATLDSLRADLALLERQLSDSELRAPQKGVIQTRILEVGEMASPERPVFTLALSDPKWVRAYVPEPDLGRLQSGMRATIHSDSFGGRSYAGWIGFISPVAEFTPKAVETGELRTQLVYEVRVLVRDEAGELPLGMPVTVDVDTEGGTGHAPERAK